MQTAAGSTNSRLCGANCAKICKKRILNDSMRLFERQLKGLFSLIHYQLIFFALIGFFARFNSVGMDR